MLIDCPVLMIFASSTGVEVPTSWGLICGALAGALRRTRSPSVSAQKQHYSISTTPPAVIPLHENLASETTHLETNDSCAKICFGIERRAI